MEQIEMSAKTRGTGKSVSKRLRRTGFIPAILYGGSVQGAIPLSLERKELDRVMHTAAGENVIINLNVEGETGARTAMFKDIFRDPVRDAVEHVDLLEVLMDRRIAFDVPVHIVGKAAGLDLGGILQSNVRKIRVECLPTGIPDSIDVDVTNLNIGSALHLKNIALPEGVTALDDPELTIVSVVAPVAEVAPKTAEEVEAELKKSFEEKPEEKEKEEEA